MGTSTSKIEPVCWIDFEGGIRGAPLWDAAMAIDGEQAGLRGVRIVQPFKPTHMTKLRKSLPPKIANKLQIGHTWLIDYAVQPDDQKWMAASSRRLAGDIRDHLETEIPRGCTLAAWNMNAHDKKVLHAEIGKEATDRYHTVDPLRFFKKHVGLPSNTLSNKRPGTPRAVFKVQDYSYLGPEHTAFVDVLNMREVTRKAAYAVHNATDGNIDIDDVHGKTDGEYALAVQHAFQNTDEQDDEEHFNDEFRQVFESK